MNKTWVDFVQIIVVAVVTYQFWAKTKLLEKVTDYLFNNDEE